MRLRVPTRNFKKFISTFFGYTFQFNVTRFTYISNHFTYSFEITTFILLFLKLIFGILHLLKIRLFSHPDFVFKHFFKFLSRPVFILASSKNTLLLQAPYSINKNC